MRKLMIVIYCCCVIATLKGQDLTIRLKNAFTKLEADSQLRYGIAAIYVSEMTTGKVIFTKNERVGLAPASSQKIITAATAFALLGKDFRYSTHFGYAGPVQNNLLKGDIFVKGSGDPTLGSPRFLLTSPGYIFKMISAQLEKSGIKKVEGTWRLDDRLFESQSVPDGWIWEDIGNYYGAGISTLNWNENQYDLWLKPGKKEGDAVSVIRTVPSMTFSFENELLTGKRGSGDQAYLFFNPDREAVSIRGTIPCCVDSFRISGAVPDPEKYALGQLSKFTSSEFDTENKRTDDLQLNTFYTHLSPTLDSLVYWFLQKSINLYGEALIKTIAVKMKGKGTMEDGLEEVKSFWAKSGIDKQAINIIDGSGLSPSNRVNVESLVKVLLYSSKKPWFSSYYNALPELNSMRMKSGTIEGVRAYTGYVKSKSGKQYCFAIIVNNYSGSSSLITRKMWNVLDVLK